MKHFYPPKREKGRFLELKKYKDIYDGDHINVFNHQKPHLYINNINKKILYIAVNLAAKISEYYSSLILGDGIFFDVDDNGVQEQVNEIVNQNDFDITLLEGAIDQSRYGYFLLRVRTGTLEGEEGKAIIEQVPNDQFVIEFTHDLKAKIKRLELFAFIRMMNEKGKEIKYLFKEIYLYPNGKVEEEEVELRKELWRVDINNQPEEKVNLEILDPNLSGKDSEMTGLNFIPARLINNSKPSGVNFGKSDYKDLMDLFEELNDKVSMISKQLMKHMNSKIAVPQNTLDDDGNLRASEADIFEVADGEHPPSYIVNSNPQIDQGFKHIEHIIRDIAAIAQMPLQSLGFDTKGGVESPEGFKLKNFETEQRINKKRLYMDTPLQFIINTALFLESETDKQKIEVVWSDVLPEDLKITTEVLALQVNSGLKSKETAIKELQELDEEQLEEEIARIAEDNKINATNLNELILPSAEPVEEVTPTNPLLDNL